MKKKRKPKPHSERAWAVMLNETAFHLSAPIGGWPMLSIFMREDAAKMFAPMFEDALGLPARVVPVRVVVDEKRKGGGK